MNYAYIRVSTQEQNTENQKKAIGEKFQIDKWIEETRSGTVDYRKRNLGILVEEMAAGDTLVITELSRLGRSLAMIFNIISILKEKKIRCIAIKNNFDMNPLDNNDIITSVLLFAFGLSAQIERELISERTKQGLAVARAKGKRCGRRKGESIYYCKLRKYEAELVAKRDAGRTINSLAVEYNVKWKTMSEFFKRFVKMQPPEPLTYCPRRHGHPTYRELQYFETHDV